MPTSAGEDKTPSNDVIADLGLLLTKNQLPCLKGGYLTFAISLDLPGYKNGGLRGMSLAFPSPPFSLPLFPFVVEFSRAKTS